MNILQVPPTLVMLTAVARREAAAAETGPAGRNAAPAPRSGVAEFGTALLNAVKQPVVWAPISALILIMLGVELPKNWAGSFTLLGQATGGVALFAVGAVLYAQKIGFSWPIVVNVALKNLLLPAVVFVGMLVTGSSSTDIGLATITIAIPTASVTVIFAVQYKKAEREMATTLFISTILSVLTMGLFIWLSSSIK